MWAVLFGTNFMQEVILFYQIQKEQPNIYNDYIICITILSVLQSLSLQSLLLFNVILSNINFIITITWPLRVRLGSPSDLDKFSS